MKGKFNKTSAPGLDDNDFSSLDKLLQLGNSQKSTTSSAQISVNDLRQQAMNVIMRSQSSTNVDSNLPKSTDVRVETEPESEKTTDNTTAATAYELF